MKTYDFNVARRCLQVLAQVENMEWVSCQYVTAAAMFPPERMARRANGASGVANLGLYNLVTSGCAVKRKIGSTRKNEYQLTEKGWQLARQYGFINQETK